MALIAGDRLLETPTVQTAAPGRVAWAAPPLGWGLGILLPLTLAIGWELAVWLGLSSGRLLPPPSRIFATFQDLSANGELFRHALATSARVAAGFALGVFAGTLLGA